MPPTRRALIAVLLAAGCSKSPAAHLPDDGAAGDAWGEAGAQPDGGASEAAAGEAVDAPAAELATDSVTAQYRSCVAYFRAQCNRQNVCGGGAEIADPCPTITDHCPDIEFSPGSGRTPQALLACAEAWRTFPCQMVSMGQTPCPAPAGSLPDGAPCTSSLQCGSGWCGKGADGQHPKCGACGPIPPPTQCGDAGVCQADEQCLSGACKKVVTGVQLGQACDATHFCASPNVCLAAGAGASTCQPVPRLGEPCSGVRLCADGSLCTAARKCEPIPTLGQACKRDAVFNRYACDDADVCDEMAADGPTCVTRPGAGGTCTPTQGGSLEQGSCARGLYCACPSGAPPCKCIHRRQEGETCDAPDDLCVPGTTCVSGKCAAVALGTTAAACGP